MLKTVIFFLFGCSLCFGQNAVTTGVSSRQTSTNYDTTSGANSITNTSLEGDGTKTTSTSGQGSGTSPFAIIINQSAKNDLNIYLMPSDMQFTKYTIYDLSGNVKKTQQISPTNSCSIDVSNLAPGNYLIKVEAVSSAIVTKLFVKM